MTENYTPIKLANWEGDANSLIVEMKRRAGVGTDGELAECLGLSQSAVSHWRRRKAVPESMLLALERALDIEGFPHARAMYARALAMRLAEYEYQKMKERGGMAGRAFIYSIYAGQLDVVVEECMHQLELIETSIGIGPDKAADLLIEDQTFYQGLSEWAKGISAAQAMLKMYRANGLLDTKRPKSRHIDLANLDG